MPVFQYPGLSLLSCGFAALAGACFVTFARLLSAQPGLHLGRLLASSVVVAAAWWSAVLLAQLAFSPELTTLNELNAGLLSGLPLIGGIMAGLLLGGSRVMPRHVFGAAGALTVVALLHPLSIALASISGVDWGALAVTAGIVYACILPALILIAPHHPAFWRTAGSMLLMAIGILFPQLMRLLYWPAGETPFPREPDWLGQVIPLNAGVAIVLFLLIRRLLDQGSTMRVANAQLALRIQELTGEKEALAEAYERHCDQLLRSANVGYCERDIPAGRISYRGTWATMLGYNEAQADELLRVGDPWRQLCHPRELNLVQRLLGELASGRRERISGDLRLRTAQHTWHWVQISARVVEHLADGSPRLVMGTQTDIDRVKRMESILLAERRLFVSGPVIIVTFEREPPHRLRQASANLQEARGHPELPLPIGQPLAVLLHRDDAPELAKLLKRVSEQPGIPAQREVRLVGIDNSWRWYVLNVVADRSDTATQRAYLVDINRVKEAESKVAAHNQALQEVVDKMRVAQRFMEKLQQFSELLQLCDDEAESRQIINQGGTQLFPGWSGALTFADANGMMEVAASWGQPFPAGRSEEADCWAVRRGRMHQINAAAEPGQTQPLSPVCGHFGGGATLPPGIRHAICTPLLRSFDRPGVLHLIAHETMSAEQLRATVWGVELFADALKLALGNLRLRTSLREQAVHDAMTDLYNRRYFDEALERELSRCQRTGEGLILAILDIDHFKTFNDNFGHEAGDQVIKSVAEQLRGFVRAYDIACRIGGEELAIIMPRAHIDEAFDRLDRLREEIGSHQLQHEGNHLPPITVSIGLAGLDNGSPDDLMRHADTALYAAKHSGRNQVKVWTPELEPAAFEAAAPRPPGGEAAAADPPG